MSIAALPLRIAPTAALDYDRAVADADGVRVAGRRT
jgi:hypothetical protein